MLISPFMPGSAAKIQEQIGIADAAGQNFDTIREWGALPPGNELKRGESLFPRVEIRTEGTAPEAINVGAPPIKPEIASPSSASTGRRRPAPRSADNYEGRLAA